MARLAEEIALQILEAFVSVRPTAPSPPARPGGGVSVKLLLLQDGNARTRDRDPAR